MVRGTTAQFKFRLPYNVCDISVIKILMQEAEKEECTTLVEKIYALSERDVKILTNMIELMQ